MAQKAFSAIVIGATGAIGSKLVDELIQSPSCSNVFAIARKTLPQTSPKLHSILVPNFQDLKDPSQIPDSPFKAIPNQFQVAFCCLGTTRKDAGSAEAFRKVDLDYTTYFAQLCKNQLQVDMFILVSSASASPNSWFLYSKTKGEAEEAIKALKFPSTVIIRPGLLDRGEQGRWVEKLAKVVVPSILVKDIATGMLMIAQKKFESDSQSNEEASTGTFQLYEGITINRLFPFWKC